MITLFHVSKKPNLTTLIPVTPNHFLTAHLLEEGVTKRVSFAPSIQKCLRAVQSRPGDTYYVYTPVAIDKKYLKRVSVYEVPDARLTGEYWYLKPVNVRLYAVIKSGKIYNTSVFRVGGIEARRPEDRPLYGVSGDREYELLKRYNKKGAEMKIKNPLMNREPEPEKKGFFSRLFGRDSMYNDEMFYNDFFGSSERERERERAKRRNLSAEDIYDLDEYELDLKRRRREEKRKMNRRLLLLAAQRLLM